MAGCASGPSQENSKRLVNLLHMSKMTESEADKIFKSTNYLLCYFPKSQAKNHPMTTCGFLKKYGITCTYERSTDMTVPEIFCIEVNNCKKKNAKLNAKDAKKAAKTDKKVQAKKDAAIKEQAAVDAAGMSTVGADGKILNLYWL